MQVVVVHDEGSRPERCEAEAFDLVGIEDDGLLDGFSSTGLRPGSEVVGMGLPTETPVPVNG